ncbi:MAG: signal peptide peptidase SppA [Chloroflexota bacterium]
MKNRALVWVLVAVAITVVLACGSAGMAALVLMARAGATPATPNGVAVLEAKGAIVYGAGIVGLRDSTLIYSDELVAAIKRADSDPAVSAIVLDVNSPGGSVVGSVDIYNALLATGKPVVTSMGEVAASGGYYIACASQYILARPSTITGSIGVISQYTNISELADALGIQVQTIKTGAYKDQGSLYRPLNEEELALLQAILDEAYEEFVAVIARGRDLPRRMVRPLADGRILSGRQAVDAGLVDALGNLDDAIKAAAEMAGIVGEPQVIRYDRQPDLFSLLPRFGLGSATNAELALLERVLGTPEAPSLQYLYTGHK